MKLKLDYNFVLKEIIGEEGISFEALSQLNKKSHKIHERIIQEKKDKIIGFFDLPYADTSLIKSKVKELKSLFKYCIVLGIGGSALGTIAIYEALGNIFDKNLFVIDNIDPDIFNQLLKHIKLEESFFVIISKSGSTVETISQFMIVRDILIKNFGFEGYKKRIVIITDPDKGPLRELVLDENLTSFSIPPNVGGRFSVLSPVGLFPLEFSGVPIDELLEGALFMINSLSDADIFKNQAYLIGAINYLFYMNNKNILVLMPYSSRLKYISDWFKQLWAESLGKDGKGSTPLTSLGTTDQHSQLQLFMEGPKDKLINFIKIENFDTKVSILEDNLIDSFNYLSGNSLNNLINFELEATRVALAKSSVPNYTVTLNNLNPFTIGELIILYEVATVFTGYLMEINPFNQPGVEESKHFVYGFLGRKGFEHKKQEFEEFIKKTDKRFII